MAKCNGCGKPIKSTNIDFESPLIIRYAFGYGSKRDSEKLEATLCTDCIENLADYLVIMCAINPISETTAI